MDHRPAQLTRSAILHSAAVSAVAGMAGLTVPTAATSGASTRGGLRRVPTLTARGPIASLRGGSPLK